MKKRTIVRIIAILGALSIIGAALLPALAAFQGI
jgi:hypothetical protein